MHYFVQGSNKTSRTPESIIVVDDTWDFEHAVKFLKKFSGLIDSAIGTEFCVHILNMSAEILMSQIFDFLPQSQNIIF